MPSYDRRDVVSCNVKLKLKKRKEAKDPLAIEVILKPFFALRQAGIGIQRWVECRRRLDPRFQETAYVRCRARLDTVRILRMKMQMLGLDQGATCQIGSAETERRGAGCGNILFSFSTNGVNKGIRRTCQSHKIHRVGWTWMRLDRRLFVQIYRVVVGLCFSACYHSENIAFVYNTRWWLSCV